MLLAFPSCDSQLMKLLRHNFFFFSKVMVYLASCEMQSAFIYFHPVLKRRIPAVGCVGTLELMACFSVLPSSQKLHRVKHLPPQAFGVSLLL